MDALKPFTFHGVLLKEKGDNAIGSCPFCDKENHFFVKTKTGQYNCRRCSAEGNVYTFIEELWKAGLGSVKTVALQKLADERSLDLEEMIRWGFRVSRVDNAFLLPMYNTKGKFSNVARIVKSQGKWVVYGTPTLKLHPFGTTLLQTQQKYLWVCEGPWDAISLSFSLRNVRQDGNKWIAHTGDKIAIKSYGVIGTPGATTFAVDWSQYFLERDVRLVFDNDHPNKSTGKSVQPGWDGMQRIVRICEENDVNSSKLQILAWGPKGYDPGLPSGYDIRDLSKSMPPQQMLSFLCSRLKNVTKLSSPEKNGAVAKPVEPIECTDFGTLCDYFKNHLHFTPAMEFTLAVCIATVISTPLPGEQLWFRIIGPPGSGKTTLAECVSVAREYCFPKSILTGFHSGMRKSKYSGGKEPSLIPLMNGKCVVIKDADTLLNAGNKDKILSELRDIYDGSSRTGYRTGKHQDFEELRNSFLLCGTDALRGLNRSFLGERFLDCDILGDSPTSKFLDSAFQSAFSSLNTSLTGSEATGQNSRILKQATYGLLRHLCTRIQQHQIKPPTITSKGESTLKATAQLLSFTRARVERDKEGMMYRPRAELATRLTKQFAKLAICLSIVYEESSINSKIIDGCGKVMLDTSHGFEYEIIQKIHEAHNGQSAHQMHSELGIAESTVRRICDDLQELFILERREQSNQSGVGGRNAHLWYLTKEVRDVIKTSKGL